MEIARLDENGVLIGVEPCSEVDHKTDPMTRSVRLDHGHDVANMIGQYKWDFAANTFIPLSGDPFSVASRDDPELVEGFVEVIEDMLDYFDSIATVANDIVDAVDANPPLMALRGEFSENKGKKLKKVKKFLIPDRTARTIKRFRRNNPRRQVAVTDTSIQTEYEIISREPETEQ